MSEQTPPVPPDGGAGTTPPVAAVPPAVQPFVVSKEEWLDFRREVRSVKEQLGKAPPVVNNTTTAPTPAPDLAAQLEEMRTDLALRDAFDAHRVAAGNPLRELITTAAKASKPPDLAAFVAKYAGMVAQPAPAAAPVPAPIVKPIAPSDTGAPDNPFKWGPEITKHMKDGEFHEAVKKWERTQGMGNPLAAMRAHAEAARKR
jgi:hypothetical protein